MESSSHSTSSSESGQPPVNEDRDHLEQYFRGELDTISAAVLGAVKTGSQEAVKDVLFSSVEKLNILYVKVGNARGGETIRVGAVVINLAKALRPSSNVVVFA